MNNAPIVTARREENHRLPEGTVLEEYTINRFLGGGGFSQVYLARRNDDDRLVVIKEYLPMRLATRGEDLVVAARSADLAPRFQRGRTLFFQEAGILSGLQHPNIIRVLGFFRANGTVYMVMEYLPGANLERYIRRHQQLSERLLLTVFRGLLEALDYIHAEGFLHLDIKPGNIHLCQGGRPILLDFGAVHRRERYRHLVHEQVITPGFAPIEQYSKKGYIGPWTDNYAIGASMWACMGGKPPPDARKRQEEDLLPAASVQFRRRYSPELLKAVEWAMDMDPLVRPQTAAELLEVLPDPGERAPLPESWLSRFVAAMPWRRS